MKRIGLFYTDEKIDHKLKRERIKRTRSTFRRKQRIIDLVDKSLPTY